MNLPLADYRIVIRQAGGECSVEYDSINVDMSQAWAGGSFSERETMGVMEEMRFWLRIMSDHAKLIRNGFDLAEEELFRFADALAENLDGMLARVQSVNPPFSPGEVQSFIAESNAVVVPLREFKADLEVAIRECRVMTDRPAELIDHVRREAEFFLGIINGLVGGPIPTRCNLKIPTRRGRRASLQRLRRAASYHAWDNLHSRSSSTVFCSSRTSTGNMPRFCPFTSGLKSKRNWRKRPRVTGTDFYVC